ncbi:MAG: hypothetical protein OJJ21_06680 [Ferrovibrio sp.]|uniref:hypothetical protein n=1 Tax=Ferrovibrio sp. TaxID=1917215 RepID=UPI00260DCBEB|nr:hypothetical protein [Ferrovibrio sp.]MCW0233264.1 hypothetical protein [Ferrovibrio sp.]
MEIRATCRGRSRRHRVLLLTTVSLLLAGCSVPDSMHVRKGSDPKYEDDDVRFRTTYYFRVFDLCEGLTEMQKPREKLLFDSAQRGPYYLKTDSLYRFVMTGKANALGNDIHFESGTLRKEQIDPFGTAIRYNQSSGSFLIENQAELKARAKQAETVARIRELVALRAELAKIDGSNVAVDAIVKQHLDDLAPSGKAMSKETDSIPSTANQTGLAKSNVGLSKAIQAAVDQVDTSNAQLKKILADADVSLRDILKNQALKIAQSADTLLEPGKSAADAHRDLTDKVLPFFDKADQAVTDSTASRAQKNAALAQAKTAEQTAASDLDPAEKARLVAARQKAEAEAKDAGQAETVAKSRQAELAKAAAATRKAKDLLATLAIATDRLFSSGFRSTLLSQINAAAAPLSAGAGAGSTATALHKTLEDAKQKDYALPPETLHEARQLIYSATQALASAPQDPAEKQAKADLETAMAKTTNAVTLRPLYIETIADLADTAKSVETTQIMADKLTIAALPTKAPVLKAQIPTGVHEDAGKKANTYSAALAQRIALHNVSVAGAAPDNLATVDKAMDEAARAFRTAADTADTETAKALTAAKGLQTDTSTMLAPLRDMPKLSDSKNQALIVAVTAVRAGASRISTAMDAVVKDTTRLQQNATELKRIAGRQIDLNITALQNETAAGNIRCDNGLSARRGFQVLGPEGFRTFDQDERLIMAMSTSAKPLIGTLTDVSNRMINARKGTVDTGRQIADERRRAGRARDVLDTFTVIGKDSSYSASDLAKRVSAAFNEASDKQRK